MFSLLPALEPGGRWGFIGEKLSGSTTTSTKIHLSLLPFSFDTSSQQRNLRGNRYVKEAPKSGRVAPSSTSPGRDAVMEMAALSAGGYRRSAPLPPPGSQRNTLPSKLTCQDIVQRLMVPDARYSPLLWLCLLGRGREGGGDWISLQTPHKRQKGSALAFNNLHF